MKKKVKVEQKAKEDNVCGDCDAATAAEVVSNIDEALDSEHDADGDLHWWLCPPRDDPWWGRAAP